ncbi:MAG: crotonase/enoyl-CoA hydratase family protein [Myxococcales bacterium]|nr:crotonase/enoyl-CoA hydratase family protein [Myxococcales bacterium]
MSHSTFSLTIEDQIAHLVLCRPEKLNSLTLAFFQELYSVCHELGRQREVRALVISSTGKHFTAGLDLMALGTLAADLSDGERSRAAYTLRSCVRELQESISAVEALRIPVLIATHGGCIGGGVDLATACDLRYCTQDAFFCVQETNVGLVADLGTLQRLPKLIPDGIARELCLTGRRLPADRALDLGLVSAVFPDQETMLREVKQTAKEIASKSPLVVAGIKDVLNFGRDHGVQQGLDYVAVWQAGMLSAQDIMEQAAAKGSGRAPAYQDLPPPKDLVRLK